MGHKVPRLPRGKVARRIVLECRLEPRRLWTPKKLAGALGLNEGTVRKELRRIIEPKEDGTPPPLISLGDGHYKAFIDTSCLNRVEQPDLELHAIQLCSKLPLNKGWGLGVGGPPVFGGLTAQKRWREVVRSKDGRSMGQHQGEYMWRGRRYFVVVSSTTGSIQVSMSASDNPLKPADLDQFLEHLDPLMEGLGLVWRRSDIEVPLNNVEAHFDYRSLFIGAKNRVKLKKFRNSWAQIYQKGEKLRMEIRMHPVEDEELRWSELASILGTITTPLRAEQEKQERDWLARPDPKLPPPSDMEVV